METGDGKPEENLGMISPARKNGIHAPFNMSGRLLPLEGLGEVIRGRQKNGY